jgi:hypothetical protein
MNTGHPGGLWFRKLFVLEGGADGTTRQDDESDDDPRDPAK